MRPSVLHRIGRYGGGMLSYYIRIYRQHGGKVAGISDHVWTLEEIEIAALAPIEAPKKRGSYKKRQVSN